MKIVPTRRTDYAIRALIYLAGSASERVNATEVADEMEIPRPILYRVLRELQRAALVTSQPGPNGGYRLTRDPAEITLLEIVEALEGSVPLDQCALSGGPCHWDQVCALHEAWIGARQAFADTLANHTLKEVADADQRLRLGVAPVPLDSHRR